MNENATDKLTQADKAEQQPAKSSGSASPSRRRLIKLGTAAVPVVATLASRPALAWHCQSPSAWGSELLNPNTSLKTNAGHQSYPDETWYISNWKDNVARPETGTNSLPWNKLKYKFPTLHDSSTTTSGSFDYTKVTVTKLTSITGIHGAGANGGATVKSILTSGTAHQKASIVAQLNYILLSPLGANEIEMCLSLDDLKKMSAGTYQTSGQTWDPAKVVQYLYNNWIAR